MQEFIILHTKMIYKYEMWNGHKYNRKKKIRLQANESGEIFFRVLKKKAHKEPEHQLSTLLCQCEHSIKNASYGTDK